MHLRGALRVLLWFIAAVALALGAGELGVRWLAPQTPPGMLVADAAMGFRLAPNYRGQQRTKDGSVALAFNSWGLRDREYGKRVPGSLRIYVLGDSFVFGYGVPLDDSFTKVLERTLQQRLGSRPVEVVNGGVPRFCTIQEATLLERTIDQVKPDLVLLGFFMGNDVLDNLEFARARKPRLADTRATGMLGWVRVHSQLYMWARHRHNRAQGRESDRQRQVMEQYAASPSGDMAAGMAATEESILGLAKTVE